MNYFILKINDKIFQYAYIYKAVYTEQLIANVQLYKYSMTCTS